MKTVQVKDWFIRHEFDTLQREYARMVVPEIVRKTEKAFLLEWNVPNRGGFRRWVPISATE